MVMKLILTHPVITIQQFHTNHALLKYAKIRQFERCYAMQVSRTNQYLKILMCLLQANAQDWALSSPLHYRRSCATTNTTPIGSPTSHGLYSIQIRHSKFSSLALLKFGIGLQLQTVPCWNSISTFLGTNKNTYKCNKVIKYDIYEEFHKAFNTIKDP